MAGFLAWDYGAMRGVNAVANGWLQRARRLVEDLEPSAEHAWLPLIEASFHLDTDPAAVLRLSTRGGRARARASAALDIEMTARTLQGLALVSLGRVEEGTRLLDEGTAAATAGELYDPIAIGSCCCNMIIACERARDFDRAGQWCEQLAGVLRADRAATAARALPRPPRDGADDARRVGAPPRRSWPGRPASCRRCGRRWPATRARASPSCAAARAASARRARWSRRPARTCSRRWSRPSSRSTTTIRPRALGYAERYLRGLGGDQPIESAAALELLVPIRIRLGELAAAREAHARLAAIADAVGDRLAASGGAQRRAAGSRSPDGTPARRAPGVRGRDRPLRAQRRAVRGGAGPAGAGPRARGAGARRGRARAGAGGAGGVRGARRRAGRARQPDKLVAQLGGRSAAAQRAGLTVREVEVLALVAEGLSNREIAERLVVSEHTVHRHLANIYARLGVSSRAAAVALAAERDLLDLSRGPSDGPKMARSGDEPAARARAPSPARDVRTDRNRARDFTTLEPKMIALYEAVLDDLEIGGGTRLLDVGCGAGAVPAAGRAARRDRHRHRRGRAIHRDRARRLPDADLTVGDMESLPYADGSFDVVTGFDAFQFAADPGIGLREAVRVSRPDAPIVIATWGRPEHCEAAALREGRRVAAADRSAPPTRSRCRSQARSRRSPRGAGLTPATRRDVLCVWSFPDEATLLRALKSTGFAVEAIDTAGEEAVDRGRDSRQSRRTAPSTAATGSRTSSPT